MWILAEFLYGLSFRISGDSCDEILSCSDNDFRVACISQDKKNDEGYRVLYIYHQFSNIFEFIYFCGRFNY